MSSGELMYCFVDTDVLIHFQTFDEVDWLTVLEARQVCLVLAPIVMKELNKHKDDSSNAWRQRRARMLVSKLKVLLKGVTVTHPAEVRSDVTLFDIPREPMIDWAARGLDPGVGDDRLIAAIIRFIEKHTPNHVTFVSNDFLAQRKAEMQGISTLEPEGRIQQLDRDSPEAATIRKLAQEIRDLKSRSPDITLSFWENEQATHMVTRPASEFRGDGKPDAVIADIIGGKRQGMERIIFLVKDSRVTLHDSVELLTLAAIPNQFFNRPNMIG